MSDVTVPDAHEPGQVAPRSVSRRSTQMQRALQASILLAQHITSILELEPLLQQATELIHDRYDYDFVAVFLIDPAGSVLLRRSYTGAALSDAPTKVRLDDGNPVGQAAQSRQMLSMSIRPVSGKPDEPSVAGVRLLVPLEVGGQLLGVLDIQGRDPEAFAEGDVAVVRSLAGQVAVAIQNALRYRAEQRRRRFAEKLVDVGRALSRVLDLDAVLYLILKQVNDIVPHDRGSIMLQSDDREAVMVVAERGFAEQSSPLEVRIPIKAGDVFHTIRETQQPLMIGDVQSRSDWEYVANLPPARSWLGVPLILQGEVIGMLSLTREQPVPYADEEVMLSTAFAHQASVALHNARLYDRISRINERLAETIDELEQRTEDLRIAYKQLERLDRTKSDFINVASHELRTPLTVLSGYSQMLLGDPQVKANDYHYQLVAGINAGTVRLHKIIDNMVDMARIDGRVLKLHPEPLFAAVLIRSVRSTLEEIFEQRGIEVAVDPSLDGLPLIEADTEATRKVFYHLMVNAIKYTPDGGQVRVHGSVLPSGHAHCPDGGIEIIVSDTGIGIAREAQELIFAKFYQTGEISMHSSGIAKFKGGGPGLGLAIARGIVEAHGGKIWVESPGYDEQRCPGSDFHVVLPLTPRILLDNEDQIWRQVL